MIQAFDTYEALTYERDYLLSLIESYTKRLDRVIGRKGYIKTYNEIDSILKDKVERLNKVLEQLKQFEN